ncbi:MAG: OB-fold nucleic acid binding domain-containing protein, partial [Candidatus Aenigmarchaeota archaeon]|nr:OB-fold nucleic acid binding domain-containing protein [Candidatus Aenigmarchaeota archaeon]
MKDKKRLVAKKVRISDIVNGKYFSGSKEEMRPSYVVTPFGDKISRVNLIATVIDKFQSEDEYSAITIDDGTEAIRVKTFRESTNLLQNIELGDLVLVIGKLKEYNGEVYVNGEIVKRIEDPNLESLRRLEVLNNITEQKKIVEEIKNLKDKMSREELEECMREKFGIEREVLEVIEENLRVAKVDYKPKIIELIDSLDEGSGVEINKIFELSDLPESVIESAIN